MKNFLTTLFFSFITLAMQGQSLEACQQAAEKNYPLIRQYALIEQTTAFTIENIKKGWLPQISASAQVTYQSDVTAWPKRMATAMQLIGLNMEGLKKDQYRLGIDVQQTIYDGGMIRSQQNVAEAQAKVETMKTEVTLFQVRKRVSEMYFALLLLDEQIRLNNDLQHLLQSKEKQLEAMVTHGTAAESDFQNVKAEHLTVAQRATDLATQRQILQTMLSTFCGINVQQVEKPLGLLTETTTPNNRPELRAFDAQISLLDAQEKTLDAALRPKLGLFAQGFYGYPSFNMFEDMIHQRWHLNGIIGARLTWNIAPLYTRKSDKAKIQLQRDLTENNRAVFLFNNNIEQLQQRTHIARYQQLMTDDNAIIALRTAVRTAAESKLAHGIININDLIREINQENNARVQRTIHEIEMLHQMYDLKDAQGY